MKKTKNIFMASFIFVFMIGAQGGNVKKTGYLMPAGVERMNAILAPSYLDPNRERFFLQLVSTEKYRQELRLD